MRHAKMIGLVFAICFSIPIHADKNEDLILAAKNGDLALVKTLLATGADVNYRSQNDVILSIPENRTALMFAVMYNHHDVASYLLATSADPNVRDRHGETAIFHAIRSCTSMAMVDTIKLLVGKKAELNIRTVDGDTPLILACRTNYDLTPVVEILIANGLNNYDVLDNGAKTAIVYAKEFRNEKMVALLLKAGAKDIQFVSKEKQYDDFLDKLRPVDRTLINAVRSGSYQTMTGAIAAGANVNIKDFNQLTPLHLSAEKNTYEMAEYLIRMKADVNASSGNNLTALMIAATNGSVPLVKLLIAYKAKVSIREQITGFTAWDMAKLNGHTEVMLLLNLAHDN